MSRQCGLSDTPGGRSRKRKREQQATEASQEGNTLAMLATCGSEAKAAADEDRVRKRIKEATQPLQAELKEMDRQLLKTKRELKTALQRCVQLNQEAANAAGQRDLCSQENASLRADLTTLHHAVKQVTQQTEAALLRPTPGPAPPPPPPPGPAPSPPPPGPAPPAPGMVCLQVPKALPTTAPTRNTQTGRVELQQLGRIAQNELAEMSLPTGMDKQRVYYEREALDTLWGIIGLLLRMRNGDAKCQEYMKKHDCTPPARFLESKVLNAKKSEPLTHFGAAILMVLQRSAGQCPGNYTPAMGDRKLWEAKYMSWATEMCHALAHLLSSPPAPGFLQTNLPMRHVVGRTPSPLSGDPPLPGPSPFATRWPVRPAAPGTEVIGWELQGEDKDGWGRPRLFRWIPIHPPRPPSL